jgi:hypothetical protein
MKLLLIAVLAASVCASVAEGALPAPAIKYQDDVFGPILATHAKKALYTSNVEKRAGGKIR